VKKEIGTSLGIIVFCALLVQQALALPKPRFEPLGPAFFPLLVLGCVIGLSVLHIAIELRKARQKVDPATGPAKSGRTGFGDLLPWICVAAFAGYVLLISYTDIPYLLLTFCFVALMAWTMASFSRTSWLPALGVAAGLIVLLQGVFVFGLNIMLP